MAYALADRLLRAVKASGLKYKEVSGWRSRGRGTMGSIQSILCHHTAGSKSGNMGSLGVVTNGRPGLPGPLCHFGLGRDGTVYLVGAGIANHAGKVVSSRYQNSRAIGIEAENTGLSNDTPWPEKQMGAYARLCKALIEEFDLPVSRVVGHKEAAPSRKIDPTFNMDAFRKRVASVKTGGGTSSTTAAPAPEKGIFGMTDIHSSYFAPEQKVNPGAVHRIQTGKSSHKIAPAKKGTMVTGSISFTVFDLPEGQSAEVRIITRDWKSGKDIWKSDRVEVLWGTKGYPNAVNLSLTGKSLNGTDTTEYMVIITNKASAPIKVANVKVDVIYS